MPPHEACGGRPAARDFIRPHRAHLVPTVCKSALRMTLDLPNWRIVLPDLTVLAHGLACERGDQLVFDRIDFTLKGGEALIVTGPNGAGKSTLLRLVAGLLPPCAGTLALQASGTSHLIDTPRVDVCHYIGHLDAIKLALTVEENLYFWTSYLTPMAHESGISVDTALAYFNLDRTHDLPAAYLSAGQRRRLALARLLCTPRPVWLLDEPTSALDRAAETTLNELIETHRAKGGIVVAATHAPLDLANARALSMQPLAGNLRTTA